VAIHKEKVCGFLLFTPRAFRNLQLDDPAENLRPIVSRDYSVVYGRKRCPFTELIDLLFTLRV
jgi:hypothetical protein